MSRIRRPYPPKTHGNQRIPLRDAPWPCTGPAERSAAHSGRPLHPRSHGATAQGAETAGGAESTGGTEYAHIQREYRKDFPPFHRPRKRLQNRGRNGCGTGAERMRDGRVPTAGKRSGPKFVPPNRAPDRSLQVAARYTQGCTTFQAIRFTSARSRFGAPPRNPLKALGTGRSGTTNHSLLSHFSRQEYAVLSIDRRPRSAPFLPCLLAGRVLP